MKNECICFCLILVLLFLEMLFYNNKDKIKNSFIEYINDH